jgi:predicted nucleotidyltransferase
MSFISDYQSAVESELIARLSRIFTLRAMQYQGLTQSEIAHRLGISQPAISQQLRAAPSTSGLSSSLILTAASPALKRIATDRGFNRLAVFGSVARGTSRLDSDIDLIVEPPADATITTLESLRQIFSDLMQRPVDLISYGGLKKGVHDQIEKTLVLL